MAKLDDADSQALGNLLARLGIEDAAVNSLEDLQGLMKPKKVKKERFSFETEEDDEDGSCTVVPKLTWFSGTMPIQKGHVSYTTWKHEFEGLKTIYPIKAVIQAIKRSLKSPAAEVMWCLGPNPSYDQIMEALETRYDDVAEGEVLLAELFSVTQSEKESLTEFSSKLESILYRLSQLDDATYDGTDFETLKGNFFRGLRDDKLREALRPRKEQFRNFNEMLKEARRLESDLSKQNVNRAKVHSLTIQEPQVRDRDWLEERFQKMEQKLRNDMRAQISSVQVTTQRQQGDGQGRGRGGFRGRGNQSGYRGAHNQSAGTPREQQGTESDNGPQQENNNQNDDWDPSQVICYNCGGMGHYQNGCALRRHNPNFRGSG